MHLFCQCFSTNMIKNAIKDGELKTNEVLKDIKWIDSL
jgi:hypothetical protein